MTLAPAATMDHAARRSRLATMLAKRDLDAALVTTPVNVTYLTGLTSSNAACVVRPDGNVVLATDNRYAEAAAEVCPEADLVVERRAADALVSRVAETGGSLAIERGQVTLALWDRLLEAGREQVTFEDLAGAVERLRSEKDADEVAVVARACEISVRALEGLLGGRLRGRTERDIARDLEARMLQLGGHGLAFDTIVAAGPHGAVPHHSPTDRPVDVGDLLTIDFGATVDGYHADCTRTVVIGRQPQGWQNEVYTLVKLAQQAGLDALGPGKHVANIDSAARRPITDAGYGESFVHGLGHGVGLQIHEAPWLTASPATAGTLPARTTVTVEPGIYLPGKGGVRIEDTTDVGPDTVRVLTDAPKELLVVDD